MVIIVIIDHGHDHHRHHVYCVITECLWPYLKSAQFWRKRDTDCITHTLKMHQTQWKNTNTQKQIQTQCFGFACLHFFKCIVVDRNDVETLCVVLYHQAHQESTCTVTLLNSIRLQWANCYAMHLSSDALATLQWNHTFHDNALQFFSAAHVPGHVVAAVFKAFFVVRFLELDLLWVWLVNIAHNFHCQIMAVKNMDHLKIFRGRF